MKDKDLVRASKRLALYLRHKPERIGIVLDSGGWVDVDTLLAALRRHGSRLSRTDLDEVVTRNDKQRFAFDPSGTRIRASQGHSVPIDLHLPTTQPPDRLFHGTVERFLPAIFRDGLRSMNRHDVHLSATVETATAVGSRRGRPVVLEIDAKAMAAANHEFRVTENGVWLTRQVPAEFLHRHDSV